MAVDFETRLNEYASLFPNLAIADCVAKIELSHANSR